MKNNTFPQDWADKLDEVKEQLHEFEEQPNRFREDFERMKEQTNFTNKVFGHIEEEYEEKQKKIIRNGIAGVAAGLAIAGIGTVLKHIL